MSIKGGVKSYAANPKDRTDEGIFISRVGTYTLHILVDLTSTVHCSNLREYCKL